MTTEGQRKISSTIKSYGQGLLGFIRKRVSNDADAEDILQDVWYQLSAMINTQPIEQLGAWLYRVARNKIIDRYRKKTALPWKDKRDEEDEENSSFSPSFLIAEDNPETAYQERMLWKQLTSALEELPAEQRDVFIWHELDRIPFAEIAEITGEPIGKLISRKRYAVLHLRKRLKIFYDELVDS
ncbi:RNA polymerase sigma factor [Olivibacter ginsenosidimutans]|uniref:RNA polymerase sigma factor n=1 Tax=Olivibacter ginsenosidimutans TaxID=1176537 RepID=A0ABP9BI21_9SPHI